MHTTHTNPTFSKLVNPIIAAVLALLMASSVALAHHGTTGRYNANIPIVLAGTITRATFSPPHPVLSVRVEEEDVTLSADEVGRSDYFRGPFVVRPADVGQVREIEFTPVSVFYDLRDQLSVGDRVVVLALRNCLSPHQLRSTYIQLPDADNQILSYTGDWAPGVDGCSN